VERASRERHAAPQGPIHRPLRADDDGRPFDGKGALFVGDRKVAEHTFERVLFSTSYDGFSLGADLGNRVSTLYEGPNPFQGRIVKVTIDVDTSPSTALETMRFIDAIGIRI
jgi:arylsulfatase